jgi:flagellar motility protein MotE (MotC chaperone)
MMTSRSLKTLAIRGLTFAGLCLAAAPISGALAEDKSGEPKPAVKTAREEIKTFCNNIADAARDQRYQLQKEELTKLQAQVNDRIAILEKRKTEYETWLNKRNEFLKAANAGLVDIYRKMPPDAAAAQMNLLDPSIVSAIIVKLKPAQSSLIMTEMEPKKAAMVTAIMSAMQQHADTPRNPS